VIGGYVNGLGVTRALSARGVPTAVVRTQPFDIAHRSRSVTSFDSVGSLSERPEGLAELLGRRAPEWRGSALFPTNDEALAALEVQREELSRSYRIVAPDSVTVHCLLDKRRMHEQAVGAGLDVPRRWGPATTATAADPALRFPLVVKPLVGHRFAARFGSKLLVAADRPELERCVAAVERAGIDCELFDLIPGGDERIHVHCSYVDSRGVASDGLTVRKLRQSPPSFGVARAAELVDNPEAVREAALALLGRIGFRGMATVEFKHDPRDGTFRFIELNGRSVLYNGLLRRAGLDRPWLAWADHVLGAPAQGRVNGWRGAWVHLHADLLHSMLGRRNRPVGVREFVAPYVGPRVEAVWSRRDPAPFWAQWSRTAREGAQGMLAGGNGQRLADRSRLNGVG